MSSTTKSKPLPLPLDAIQACPEVARFDVLEMGAFMGLVMAFWVSGAKPLPTEDARLAILARCHPRRWYKVREALAPALNTILRALAAEYARMSKAAAARRGIAHNAGIASAAKRQRQVKQSVAANTPLVDRRTTDGPLRAARLPRTRSVVEDRPKAGGAMLSDRVPAR